MSRSFENEFPKKMLVEAVPNQPEDDYFMNFLSFNTANQETYLSNNQPNRQAFQFSEPMRNLTLLEQEMMLCETMTPKDSSEDSQKADSGKSRANSGKVSGKDIRKLFDLKIVNQAQRPDSSRTLQMDENLQPSDQDHFQDKTQTSKKSKHGHKNKKKLHPLPKKPSEMYCICTKTKCIKMYCTCFSQGVYCNKLCQCLNCENSKEFAQSRAPGESLSSEHELKRPRTELCCTCKMSHCEKSYCTCARNGKGCSAKCSCYNCKNIYGTRKEALKMNLFPHQQD